MNATTQLKLMMLSILYWTCRKQIHIILCTCQNENGSKLVENGPNRCFQNEKEIPLKFIALARKAKTCKFNHVKLYKEILLKFNDVLSAQCTIQHTFYLVLVSSTR